MAIETILYGRDGITKLALALECAMALDDGARARYLAIYGVSWDDASDDDASATVRVSVDALATEWDERCRAQGTK